MRPVFPYASASREKQTPKTSADLAVPPRTRPKSAQKTQGKTASETTTTKCSNPTARVSTEGFSKKITAPIQAANSLAFQRLRKKYIPAAPTRRQEPTATFEPARKPKGSAAANMTAFENIYPQAIARLVPCKKLGDHHGNPRTLSTPRKKSPALAKFASNS